MHMPAPTGTPAAPSQPGVAPLAFIFRAAQNPQSLPLALAKAVSTCVRVCKECLCMSAKLCVKRRVHWAVCTAPMCTPHKVMNHPYTNMESIRRAYLGLLELEEQEKNEDEVLLAAAVFATSKRRRQCRHWVQPINQRRPQYMAHTIIFMASFSWPCCSVYAQKSVQEPRE